MGAGLKGCLSGWNIGWGRVVLSFGAEALAWDFVLCLSFSCGAELGDAVGVGWWSDRSLVIGKIL